MPLSSTTPTRRREAAEVADRDRALVALRRVVARLTASARSVESRTGITNAQLYCLRVLARSPRPLTIGELADATRTGQSAASLLVQRLERSGLVRRERDAVDARRRVVRLLARGRQLAARAPAPPTDEVLTALARLSRRDLRGLAQGLDRLATALGGSDHEPPMLFEPERR
ncbi:MAG: MarR family transcriptional regulator [Gemmatimonadaceae bacterium]|nr:MarR family transcriptional regulator [Gemmatimonadaceae bacterium]